MLYVEITVYCSILVKQKMTELSENWLLLDKTNVN